MNKLCFYDVDEKYIEYLKQFDDKLPDIIHDVHNKFVCGIVLEINN